MGNEAMHALNEKIDHARIEEVEMDTSKKVAGLLGRTDNPKDQQLPQFTCMKSGGEGNEEAHAFGFNEKYEHVQSENVGLKSNTSHVAETEESDELIITNGPGQLMNHIHVSQPGPGTMEIIGLDSFCNGLGRFETEHWSKKVSIRLGTKEEEEHKGGVKTEYKEGEVHAFHDQQETNQGGDVYGATLNRQHKLKDSDRDDAIKSEKDKNKGGHEDENEDEVCEEVDDRKKQLHK